MNVSTKQHRIAESETLIPRNRMLETGSYGSVGVLGVTHVMPSSTRRNTHILSRQSQGVRSPIDSL
ncbi:MAG: hypothetical protein HWN68_17365 [Desulfobacterales bacterium]|nr:hypothetical protein [Desulfobacterales bacterium]